jgi:hypothetical protein
MILTLHPKLNFTAEIETGNKINYLDITIHRTPTCWRISIYRKPTFTDTVIPYTSNHPTQHKYAAIRFLYNRLNRYDLLKEDYAQEESIIHNITHNNSFPIHPQNEKTSRYHIDNTTKMGHIYLHRKGENLSLTFLNEQISKLPSIQTMPSGVG